MTEINAIGTGKEIEAPPRKVLKIVSRTEFHTFEYKRFNGARLKLKNHSVDCFLTFSNNQEEITARYTEVIQPGELGSRLSGSEYCTRKYFENLSEENYEHHKPNNRANV